MFVVLDDLEPHGHIFDLKQPATNQILNFTRYMDVLYNNK